MVQIRPPSSPSPHGDGFVHNGFNHLVHHNAVTSFPNQTFEYDGRSNVMSGSTASFASPSSGYQDDGYYYNSQQSPFSYSSEYQGSARGIKYDAYSPEPHQHTLKKNDRQQFQAQYGTPSELSETPPMPNLVLDTMRTRSGLAVKKSSQALKPLPQTRSRPPKSSNMKKPKKNKAKVENRIAKLEKPLSELTKGWDHVPIVDIEAYVNRPAEERRREVEQGKIPGKVKRPMNSFMLYRKAYQNRTKDWCLQNNHQVVSQVCGDSWPLEPESVREQFNEWSRIERINHQNAHPGYKFSPSKGTPTKSSKRKVSEEPESEESDLEDFDWERGASKRNKKLPRPSPRPVDDRSYGTSISPYRYPQSRQISEEPYIGIYNKSSYQASNPGKPAPAPYSQANLLHGQYYQQTVHQNTTRPGIVEDVLIQKAAAPGMGHLGLPGGHSYTMNDPYLSEEGPVPPPEHRIDPSLIAQDHGLYGSGYIEQDTMYPGDSLNSGLQWQDTFGKLDGRLYQEDDGFGNASHSYNGMQVHDQQLQILKGNQDAWAVEPLDVGQEFDKWLGDL